MFEAASGGTLFLDEVGELPLIAAGVLPDRAEIPVFMPDVWPGQAVLRHCLVIGIYVAAFAAGRAIDRRHEALSLEVEAAARDAARAEALPVNAREEIDRAVAGDSGGLFSGLSLGGYEVRRLLGRGGVGEVYEAVHAATGQLVALKLLRRERASEAWHAPRLRSEATALRLVQSAHVARIVDAGDLEGDIPFVAMEFIPGASLADLLRQRGAIDARAAGELTRDIGTGFEDVHRAGVLHLDIKPGNLIRATGAAGWRLVDFGTAQLVDTGGAPPVVSGTPSYMSPEQARGAALDRRSDLADDDREPVRPAELARDPHRERDVVAMRRLKATRDDDLLDHAGQESKPRARARPANRQDGGAAAAPGRRPVVVRRSGADR